MRKCLTLWAGIATLIITISCAPKPSAEVKAQYRKLPPVSRQVWDLTASLPLDDVMAYAASDMDKEWPPWPYFVKSFLTFPAMIYRMHQIDSFFQHPPEEFVDEPEYWYHAWLYWEMTPEAMSFPPDEEKDKAIGERLREESRERCEHYAASYAPAAFALALDAMESADWEAMSSYLHLLETIEPENGLWHLLRAVPAAEGKQLQLALQQLRQAATAKEMSFPLDSFSQAVDQLWLEQNERLSNSLIMAYGMRPGIDEKLMKELFIYLAKEMEDAEFVEEIAVFRGALLKFARASYGYGAEQAQLVAQMLEILNDRAGEAYARAPNSDGSEATRKVRSWINKLHAATNYESGWVDAINELLKEKRKTHWSKLLPFRDLARLRVLGLSEKRDFALRRIEMVAYPPLGT